MLARVCTVIMPVVARAYWKVIFQFLLLRHQWLIWTAKLFQPPSIAQNFKVSITICLYIGADHKLMFQGKIWHTDAVQVQLYKTGKAFYRETGPCSAFPFNVYSFLTAAKSIWHKNTGANWRGHSTSGFFKGLAERIFTESCFKNT